MRAYARKESSTRLRVLVNIQLYALPRFSFHELENKSANGSALRTDYLETY